MLGNPKDRFSHDMAHVIKYKFTSDRSSGLRMRFDIESKTGTVRSLFSFNTSLKMNRNKS